MNERLLSALIGLARATEGNEELMTEETGQLIFQGLSMMLTGETEKTADSNEQTHRLTELLAKLREEKKRLVPNCFDCASPCGRTADYDMREFYDTTKEQVQLKLHLVECLAALAKKSSDVTEIQRKKEKALELCLEGLIVLGWNGSRESLLRVTEKII